MTSPEENQIQIVTLGEFKNPLEIMISPISKGSKQFMGALVDEVLPPMMGYGKTPEAIARIIHKAMSTHFLHLQEAGVSTWDPRIQRILYYKEPARG